MKPYEIADHAVLIRDLPADERPVARLERYGPGTLSLTEILAVLCGFRTLAEAEKFLADNGGLPGIRRLPYADLVTLPGFGPARAARVKAAIELGMRAITATSQPVQIKSPADAAALLLPEMATLEQEHLRVLLLSTQQTLLKIVTVYIGSLNTAVVRVGEVFKEAIRANAAALIVVHNHPSGAVEPSAEDVYVTRQIVEAGKLLGIDVLDHLVLGQTTWTSLRERGLGF